MCSRLECQNSEKIFPSERGHDHPLNRNRKITLAQTIACRILWENRSPRCVELINMETVWWNWSCSSILVWWLIAKDNSFFWRKDLIKKWNRKQEQKYCKKFTWRIPSLPVIFISASIVSPEKRDLNRDFIIHCRCGQRKLLVGVRVKTEIERDLLAKCTVC